MSKVFKYELEVRDHQQLSLPAYSQILSVCNQRERITKINIMTVFDNCNHECRLCMAQFCEERKIENKVHADNKVKSYKIMKIEYIKQSNMHVEVFADDKKVADIQKHALGYEIWFTEGDVIGYPTMAEAKREIEFRYNS